MDMGNLENKYTYLQRIVTISICDVTACTVADDLEEKCSHTDYFNDEEKKSLDNKPSFLLGATFKSCHI